MYKYGSKEELSVGTVARYYELLNFAVVISTSMPVV
jgi:hypothetical protein